MDHIFIHALKGYEKHKSQQIHPSYECVDSDTGIWYKIT